MSGFVRRFQSVPSTDVLTAIEGINIIDLPPPSAPSGISTNVIALVGEFADMTYGVAVDSSGNITTFGQPVEIFSSSDLIAKVGGFDQTLGQFGIAMGNGYVELRNKSFGRLIVCPVNLASAAGCRFWRKLPTNLSATVPTPVVPVSGATVPAGYLFTDAAHTLERLKNAAAIQFTSLVAYLTGTDGSVTHAGSTSATQPFTSAGGGFTTVARPDGKTGVQVGDILVLGVIGGAGALGADADTYRVVTVDSDTSVHVQLMSGTVFDFATTSAVLPWRLHPASTADSYGDGSGSLLTSQGSFSVPVRPITNDAGTGSSTSDGTWPTSTVLQPVVAPPALTATSADPLSGLAGAVGPTTAVAYTHLVQRPNAPNDATIDVLYQAAITSFLNDDVPESEVAHIWAARKSSTIRLSLAEHVDMQSARGTGRTCSISPELNQASTTALTTVTGNTDPGVGANRDERVFYDWPAVKTLIPEAVGLPIAGADGSIVLDGTLDTTGDGWMASILGNLDPEHNPGESSAITQGVLKPLLGYARLTPQLDINAWTLMRQRGIAGIRFDKTTGPEFQSGITTSLTNGQKNIARRKMADYIEDSLAVIAKPFVKLLQSDENKDSLIGQVVDFMELLLSPDNAANQRIAGYQVDAISGNNPTLTGLGIFVIIVRVQTLSSLDFITLQCEIGESVNVTTIPSAPNG
jgi:hypothetical protein